MIEINDFARGIITDVDNADGGALKGAARSLVNFLISQAGKLIKRYGRSAKTFDVGTYNHGTKTWTQATPPSDHIPLSGETVIQMIVVAAPTAKADSRFTSAKALNTPTEYCLNENVTFILCATGTARTYKLYGDIHTVDQYEECATVVTPNDELPYMIGRNEAVGIGNVQTSTGETGVRWYGHVKKLVCWAADHATNGDYRYLNAIDEWRFSDAECFNAHGDIKLRLGVSNFGGLFQGAGAGYLRLENMYKTYGGMKELIERSIKLWTIGGEQRRFRIKVTAGYDGYQESRPLLWDTSPVDYVGTTEGTVPYGTNDLPLAWRITGDARYNQYMRVEVGDTETHCYLHGRNSGYNGWTWSLRCRWNSAYSPNKTPLNGGHKFYVKFDWVANGRPYAFNTNSGGDLEGVIINLAWAPLVLYGLGITTFAGSIIVAVEPQVRWIMLMMGAVPLPWEEGASLSRASWQSLGFVFGPNPAKATTNTDFYYAFCVNVLPVLRTHPDLNRIRALWTVVEATQTVATGSTGTPIQAYAETLFNHYRNGGPTPADEWTGIVEWQNPNEPDQLVKGEFVPGVYSGCGMIYIKPQIAEEAVIGTSGGSSATLARGARRLTHLNLYIYDEDEDIDYRLIRTIWLDRSPADPTRRGSERDPEGIDGLIPDWTFRDQDQTTFAFDTASWIRRNGYIEPNFNENHVAPYNFAVTEAQHVRGGLDRIFIIGSTDFIDADGKSTISANLLRDEDKTDAPLWTRGAVCEGRLLAIHGQTGNVQYNVMAGGVAQWDIMPGDGLRIAKGEKLTHIVSWRGFHHIIFTDQNLWRIDLADGDEMNWRVLDTFTKRGTELWRAIVDTSAGLVYPNTNGVWVYGGDNPRSLTEEKWQREYVDTWSKTLTPVNTYGGYHALDDEVYLVLDSATVWCLKIGAGAPWRQELDAGGKRPAYMTTYRNQFLQSFGAADLRYVDVNPLGSYKDLNSAFPVYYESHELPSVDPATSLYWQYCGVRHLFDSQAAQPSECRISTVMQAIGDDYAAHLIAVPINFHEWMFPIPYGPSRGIRIRFGQGTLVGGTNDPGMVELNYVTLRGMGYNRDMASAK